MTGNKILRNSDISSAKNQVRAYTVEDEKSIDKGIVDAPSGFITDCFECLYIVFDLLIQLTTFRMCPSSIVYCP